MKPGQPERREIHWMIAREIPALRRYANTLIRNHGDSDDLVQDTLERAIKKSHTWRREGSIRGWLYRIQYTVFLNFYKKQAALKEVTAEDMGESPDMSISAFQDSMLECQRILIALEKLKPLHREVLLLIALEGFSYDQAAQIINIPVGTVRSRLMRARKDLRDEMKNTPLNKTVRRVRK